MTEPTVFKKRKRFRVTGKCRDVLNAGPGEKRGPNYTRQMLRAPPCSTDKGNALTIPSQRVTLSDL